MMGITISAVLDDWFYNEAILKRCENISESARIRELLVKGWKLEQKGVEK